MFGIISRTSAGVLMPSRSRETLLAALLALGLALFSGVASAGAQDDSNVNSSPATPAASAPATAASEIVLALERLGVGNAARAGDWAAVQISAVDSSPKPRDVVLSLAVPDADGDIATYTRVVTLNSGTPQKFWFTIRVPFRAIGGSVTMMLEAHEASSGQKPTDRITGRLLGQTPISGGGTTRILEATVGLCAVVGTRSAGLRAFADRDQPTQTYLTLGHEVTEIVEGLSAADLPDRWQGLASFDTIVWMDRDIGELRGESARAVREWVRRGGHLIISLPSVGAAWTTPSSNELLDIMPAVKVSRRENVDLTEYRHLFTSSSSRFLSKTAVVHDLIPQEEARPGEAIRYIQGPDGRCNIARRIVDAGMVTLVGFDLASRGLGDSIDADVFWNRVLGRRGLIVPPADKQKISQGLSRATQTIDAGVHQEIAKKGQTAAAVLLGLVVFAAYWLCAGPVGHMALKKFGGVRHAWMMYVITAGAFTALAWSGATALRPRKVEASHVTIMDHVYGQPNQRTRTWASILTPGYGEAVIQVGGPNAKLDEATDQRGSGNIAAAWDAPSSDGTFSQFPDARAYQVDGRNPSSWTVPSRATVKQFQFEWLGGPRWGMPHPVAPEGGVERDGIRIVDGKLRGTLVHNLPGELRDVVVVFARGQKPIQVVTRAVAPSLANGEAVKIPVWPPGIGFNLSDAFGTGQELLDGYLNKLMPSVGNFASIGQGALPTLSLRDALPLLSFYSQLPTPSTPAPGNTESAAALQRVLTHGWDMGRWMGQPCIIIVGILSGDESGKQPAGAPSPTPVYVDGREITMSGKTIVRWIYPLDDSPPLLLKPDPSGEKLPPTKEPT